jgi:hypothetical protein
MILDRCFRILDENVRKAAGAAGQAEAVKENLIRNQNLSL